MRQGPRRVFPGPVTASGPGPPCAKIVKTIPLPSVNFDLFRNRQDFMVGVAVLAVEIWGILVHFEPVNGFVL
jgi:hypothetical protein